MFLTTFETLAEQEIQQVVCNLPDQMGGFGEQRSKKTVCIQYIISVQTTSRCIRGHQEGMLLYRSALIRSAAESCGRKRLRVVGDSEKRTLWWNQEVKEAIRA